MGSSVTGLQEGVFIAEEVDIAVEVGVKGGSVFVPEVYLFGLVLAEVHEVGVVGKLVLIAGRRCWVELERQRIQ